MLSHPRPALSHHAEHQRILEKGGHPDQQRVEHRLGPGRIQTRRIQRFGEGDAPGRTQARARTAVQHRCPVVIHPHPARPHSHENSADISGSSA